MEHLPRPQRSLLRPPRAYAPALSRCRAQLEELQQVQALLKTKTSDNETLSQELMMQSHALMAKQEQEHFLKDELRKAYAQTEQQLEQIGTLETALQAARAEAEQAALAVQPRHAMQTPERQTGTVAQDPDTDDRSPWQRESESGWGDMSLSPLPRTPPPLNGFENSGCALVYRAVSVHGGALVQP